MEENAGISKDIRNLCRICLQPRDSMKYIYEKIANEETAFSIIQSCTTLQIDSIDGLPVFICLECELQVLDIFKFKAKYEKSKSYLDEYSKKVLGVHYLKNGTAKNGGENNIYEANGETYKSKEENIYEDIDIYESIGEGNEERELLQENGKLKLNQVTADFKDDHQVVTLNKSSVNHHEIYQNEKVGQSTGQVQSKSKKNVTMKVDTNKQKTDGKDSFLGSFLGNIRSKVLNSDIEKRKHKALLTVEVKTECLKIKDDIPKSFGKARNVKKYSKTVFSCRICGQIFHNATELREHKTNYDHLPKKAITCTLCQKTLILRHYKKHFNSHMNNFICPICSKKFVNQYNLNRHKVLHETKVTQDDVAQLLGLSRTFKQKERKFICSICCKSYTTKDALSLHRIVHTDKSLTCEICQSVFPSKEKLILHKGVHQNKFFLCSICGKRCSSHTTLKLHIAAHIGIKPFKCDECDRTFTQANTLKDHLLIHNKLKPFTCKVCLQSFNKAGNFKRHMRIHSNDRPYCCDYCGKRFQVKYGLIVHRRIHTGETPYACPICSKEFKDSGARSRHIKTHY